MTTLLKDLFAKKNINFFVGIFTLLIGLWLVLFFIPILFVSLFNTILGNLILIVFIILVAMYNTNLSIGFAIMLIILWRFSHIIVEHFIL
jgi:hypothetical protein